jgi:hypothetical protein
MTMLKKTLKEAGRAYSKVLSSVYLEGNWKIIKSQVSIYGFHRFEVGNLPDTKHSCKNHTTTTKYNVLPEYLIFFKEKICCICASNSD